MTPELLETEEEFESRIASLASFGLDPRVILWERRHRDFIVRDLESREALASAMNRLAAALEALAP